MRRHRHLLAILAAFTLACNAVPLWAQTTSEPPTVDTQSDDTDPPPQAARFSYAEGSVSLQPAGVDDWTAPAINRPLTVGDQLWSDRDSRAEIEVSGAAVRLGENTGVSLLNLTEQATQLRVGSGSVVVALRGLDAARSFEIDAPNAAITLLQPGHYRVDVDSRGNTLVQTRDGQAQVTASSGQAVTLQAGQAGQFGANGAFDVAQSQLPDDFERWSQQREQQLARNDAAQYVSSDVVGADALGEYGQWQTVPDYGSAWFPTQVANDWAPYRDGDWLWVAPWGWTWVDNSPWGYAPFHYGRWTYFNRHWGWVPAPPRGHALYAPALVAWVGGPTTAGSPSASVGWLPLAPGEVYVPGYPVSERYALRVNASNTTLADASSIGSVYRNPALQDHYANRNAPHALTRVPQNNFVSGQAVRSHLLDSAAGSQDLRASARAPGIVPVRASVLGPGALSTRLDRPPPGIMQRPVLSRQAPPPVPAQFERQVDALRASGGRALPGAAVPGATSAQRADVRVIRGPAPRLLATPDTQPASPAAPRSQGPMIPERSPRFQAPAQSQPQRPAVSTPQLEQNWRAQHAPGLPPAQLSPRSGPSPPPPAWPPERGAARPDPNPQSNSASRPQPPYRPPAVEVPRPQAPPTLPPAPRPAPPAPPPRPRPPQSEPKAAPEAQRTAPLPQRGHGDTTP